MTLARAVSWVETHLSRFSIDRDASLEWRLASAKAIGELAHTADMLARREDPLREVGERWLSHAWSALEGVAWILPLLESTPRLALAASLLPVFHQRGWIEPATITRLHAAMLRAPLDGAELLYAVVSFRRLGVSLPPDVENRAARSTVLIQRPPPWRLNLLALYQLTHELFYASEWGARAPDLDERALHYARRWIPMWIELAAQSSDTDLVAELLCCHELLGGADPVESAWAVIARAQAEDGSVTPPPRVVDVRAAAMPDDAFLLRRHTTLVAAMAWSLRDQSIPKMSTP